MNLPFIIYHLPFKTKGVILVCLAFVFLLIFSYPKLTLAQSAQSNCVVTKVGNPQGDPPPCGSGSTAATSLVRIGEDIKTAYDGCPQYVPPSITTVWSGYTHEYTERDTAHPGMDVCLKDILQPFGYSLDTVLTFETVRHRFFIISPQNPKLPAAIRKRQCNQCVGYVATALAIAESSTSVLTGGLLRCAGSVNNFPGGFSAGGAFYARIGVGSATNFTPEPGDVAVAGGSCDGPSATHPYGDYGHILIVKEVLPGSAKFIALESNGGEDCKVTNGRALYRNRYTFYRKQ